MKVCQIGLDFTKKMISVLHIFNDSNIVVGTIIDHHHQEDIIGLVLLEDIVDLPLPENIKDLALLHIDDMKDHLPQDHPENTTDHLGDMKVHDHQEDIIDLPLLEDIKDLALLILVIPILHAHPIDMIIDIIHIQERNQRTMTMMSIIEEKRERRKLYQKWKRLDECIMKKEEK